MNNILLNNNTIIYSLVNGLWGGFHFLSIVSNAAVNMCQLKVSFFECLSRDGIAGSHGGSVCNTGRNCRTVFHSRCTVLDSHQHCVNVPSFPTSSKTLLFNWAILWSVRWYLVVVLVSGFYNAHFSWVFSSTFS